METKIGDLSRQGEKERQTVTLKCVKPGSPAYFNYELFVFFSHSPVWWLYEGCQWGDSESRLSW